jgi:hypothetical protein
LQILILKRYSIKELLFEIKENFKRVKC